MTTLADLERVERELRQSALEARSTADLVHAMPATADFWADTIAAYIAEQGWRPIETAPESSVVILFCDARGNRWTDCSYNRHEVCGFPATHWMPLPEPPKENSDG